MQTTSSEEKTTRLLRLSEVLALLQISKSTWWKGIQEGRFPSPVYVADRSPRWRLDDIDRLIENGVPRSPDRRRPGQRNPDSRWGGVVMDSFLVPPAAHQPDQNIYYLDDTAAGRGFCGDAARSTPTITSVASDYLARGWSIVPIPYGKKGPREKEWQKLRITRETLPNYFQDGRDSNIGVILGQPSHGLVDVDLDCAEAIDIAPRFLPQTNAVFGGKSTLASHFLFRVEGAAPTKKFVDPVTRDALVELRGDGGLQTVFPPSIHPSGERVEWLTDDEIGLA